jgi:hypothetical protein
MMITVGPTRRRGTPGSDVNGLAPGCGTTKNLDFFITAGSCSTA